MALGQRRSVKLRPASASSRIIEGSADSEQRAEPDLLSTAFTMSRSALKLLALSPRPAW